jgi:hypothetical protein
MTTVRPAQVSAPPTVAAIKLWLIITSIAELTQATRVPDCSGRCLLGPKPKPKPRCTPKRAGIL